MVYRHGRDRRQNGMVKGFTDAAKDGGLNIVASQPANWDRKKARELATKMLADYRNLKVVFVKNDDMALGVVNAVQAQVQPERCSW